MGQLSVSYGRRFGDGNFGSEALEVSWTWDEPNAQGIDEAVQAVATTLRDLVLHELSRSAAERVRWAANHELHARGPKPAVERDEVAITIDGEETDLESLPF
jgi:hypothetical protein